MSDFENKVVVVTGASIGIGRHAVECFAKQGANVVMIARREEPLRQAAEEMGLQEGKYLIVTGDVQEEAVVQEFVNRTVEAFGRIDIFVNNAGIEGTIAPIVDYPVDIFDAVVAINLRGCFLGLKYVLQVMQEQKSGVIVNLSSIGGLRGMPGTSAYVSTKYAIIGLTKTAAIENAAFNIRVNAVCPSPVNTRMMRSIEAGGNADDPESMKDLYTSMIPMGRYAETEDIVNAILFLASDQASFVTGTTLTVDGGMCA